jgi:hypothetical protein
MNIQSRLKKLQSQIIGNDSKFCGCVKEIRTVVIYPGANGEPIREPPEDYDTPEFCATCGKLNAEPLHVTISPKVELTGDAGK